MKNLIFVGISMLAPLFVSCNEVNAAPQVVNAEEAIIERDDAQMWAWKCANLGDTLYLRSENANIDGCWLHYEDPDAFDWGSKEGYPGDYTMCDCWFDIVVNSDVEREIEENNVVVLVKIEDGEYELCK